MRGGSPYRAPDHRSSEPLPAPTLGEQTSLHFRKDLQGTVARVLGWSPAAALHEGGVVLWPGTPERAEFLFDEIDAIFYDYESVLPRPRPRATLVAEGGRRGELLRDLTGLEVLLATLHRRVTRPVVIHALEALKRGEAMTFGALGIELDGIRLRGEVLPWDQLSRVVVDWDTIVIHGREPIGRFGWVPIRGVPHPRALLEVLRVRGRVLLRGRRVDPGG